MWKAGNRKSPHRCELLLFYWWPLCESNTAPTDSGLCGFHHSLDYAFTITTITIALGGCRLVSTRSKCFHTKLRSALPCALLPSGFTEFDTIPYPVSKDMAHLKYESAALTKHELRGLKLYFATTVFIMLLPQKCRSTVEANYTTFLKLNLLFLLHFITIFNDIE